MHLSCLGLHGRLLETPHDCVELPSDPSALLALRFATSIWHSCWIILRIIDWFMVVMQLLFACSDQSRRLGPQPAETSLLLGGVSGVRAALSSCISMRNL